jgi:glycogen operon protein
MNDSHSDALVFFGATGDLAYKKIFPALQAMIKRGHLNVPVIGVAKAGWNLDQFRARAQDSLEKHGGGVDAAAFEKLSGLLRYVDGDYNDPATFQAIRKELKTAQRPSHYLAIPPLLFGTVVEQLARSGCAPGGRVIVEKPFGHDLASAQELNQILHATFPESAIFRIDHYLGKRPVNNVAVFRFANAFVEPFWGLENSAYYILEPDQSRYANYSGTGNTLNTDHPVVRRMIVDSLRYWVEVMHVDGFRFDLASILDRDESGNLMPSPPVLWDIDSDPVLAGTKLIAEAWDAAGLYQVGSFIGDSWREWNGRFRDDIRSFFRGDDGSVGSLADRLLGSPQIYGHKEREAEESVNFVTCHDGFTLNDLVSYNQKHNEPNGEDNSDGANDNRSWNSGVEGPTDDPAIENLRNRQVKNFLAVTILSLGLPMISMGDEVRRTQQGNNNAYCQDNETNWFDWNLVEKHADVCRFVTMLNARRLFRDLEPAQQSLSLNEILRESNKAWHGVKLEQPDWSDSSHSLAISAEAPNKELLFHVILNAYWEPLEFELPHVGGDEAHSWRRWIDTTLGTPHDIVEWDTAPTVPGRTYRVGPRSIVVLFAPLG